MHTAFHTGSSVAMLLIMWHTRDLQADEDFSEPDIPLFHFLA
jgi:hypothetical protein